MLPCGMKFSCDLISRIFHRSVRIKSRDNIPQELTPFYWRERKGREAGVLRGRAAGEKYETLIF